MKDRRLQKRLPVNVRRIMRHDTNKQAKKSSVSSSSNGPMSKFGNPSDSGENEVVNFSSIIHSTDGSLQFRHD